MTLIPPSHIPRVTLSRANFRFELRPYQADSIHSTFDAADESRAHVAQWMDWLSPDYGIGHAHSWVSQAIEGWDGLRACEFLIYDRSDGQVAGACGLNQIDWSNLVANLGYWVRTSKLRLGAASQAAILLRDFGFTFLHLNRIEIVVATGNLPSQRVAESIGALDEGIQRQRLRVGTAVHDARMYALLRPQ